MAEPLGDNHGDARGRLEGAMIRVLIGDVHTLNRGALRALLESQPDLSVIAETASRQETLDQAISLQPDVVLLDAAIAKEDAVSLITELRAKAPQTELVMICSFFAEHLAAEVVAAGARGVLLRSDRPEDLLACIRSLVMHQSFMTPSVRNLTERRGTNRLTQRERLVVKLIAQGLRTREIAAHLQISQKTVETHRSAIFRKLELDTLADVVRYAIRNSIIDA
jgi:DNA-binding NarL/FixJ family response regulator